jgi:hypothetical protein
LSVSLCTSCAASSCFLEARVSKMLLTIIQWESAGSVMGLPCGVSICWMLEAV